jgi:hypothetical protein
MTTSRKVQRRPFQRLWNLEKIAMTDLPIEALSKGPFPKNCYLLLIAFSALVPLPFSSAELRTRQKFKGFFNVYRAISSA